jgi:Uma2 family endonuclease
MGQPAEQRRNATYADLEAVPPHQVAEIINGLLHVMPRPAPRHASASSRLTMKLGGPFDLGEGGPGGWRILDEPELHFPNQAVKAGKDVLVPDIAGWRCERMPELPETAHFALAPDWICEVLSQSTEEVDRTEKMPIYEREGVRHAWLVDPIARTLEIFALDGAGRWALTCAHRDGVRVRAEPFDAIELDLSVLWTK